MIFNAPNELKDAPMVVVAEYASCYMVLDSESVSSAKAGQRVTQDYYNLELMMKQQGHNLISELSYRFKSLLHLT